MATISNFAVENKQSKASEENSAMRIVKWIANATKEKQSEFESKIMKLVNELFQPPEKTKKWNVFEDTVKSSFMLSIVVLLIVIVAHLQKN